MVELSSQVRQDRNQALVELSSQVRQERNQASLVELSSQVRLERNQTLVELSSQVRQEGNQPLVELSSQVEAERAARRAAEVWRLTPAFSKLYVDQESKLRGKHTALFTCFTLSC